MKLLGAFIALAALILGACGGEADPSDIVGTEPATTERTTTTEVQKTTLEKLYDGDIAANLQDEIAEAGSLVELLDDGHTLTLRSGGLALDFDTVVEILLVLDVPDAVLQRMAQTRALDGMQTAQWDEFTATWTYHPDDGMNIIVEEGR